MSPSTTEEYIQERVSRVRNYAIIMRWLKKIHAVKAFSAIVVALQHEC